MRGAPKVTGKGQIYFGIIPAYAGSTFDALVIGELDGDHPRVCGEHAAAATLATALGGSSPRMRGARSCQRYSYMGNGIIPAYAGSTC